MDLGVRIEPDHSALHRSVGRCHDWEALEIEGALPPELDARFVRTGPGILDRFGVRADHAFMADGLLVGLRIRAGRAFAAVRPVQSAAYLAEQRAGRHLYGPAAPAWRRLVHALRKEVKPTGNTAIFGWQGRTFALMEAGPPIEIESSTLATLGQSDLGGVLRGAFSAHPHRLASAETTFNFGLVYDRRPRLRLYALPDRGPARRLGEVELPWNGMVHDFAVTERHAVFVVCPMKVRILRTMLEMVRGGGGISDIFRFDPSVPAQLLVVPLDDPSRPRRIPIDSRFIFHFANAFERDGELTVDFVHHPNADVVLALSGNDPDVVPAPSRVQRIRVDLRRDRVLSDEALWDHGCEFPTKKPEAEGEPYDAVWLTHRARGGDRGIARLCPQTATVDRWEPDHGVRASEAMFLPPEPRSGHEGWLVSLCLDGLSNRSFFAVLDARRPSGGPVAKLWLDQPIPTTYHGTAVT